MKAIRIHEYGDRSVLRYEDAPIPTLADDDVLVRIVASSINPVDWKVRRGYLASMINYPMPLILGWDFSGVIERVGVAVKQFEPGDEVFARPDITRNGTYAEYIAVSASEIARKPRFVSHVQAACLPLAGITAWEVLFTAGQVEAGQTVLIHAAAGGVGSLAVQLAHWKGARVIATCSAANRDLVASLGADEIIDYRTTAFQDVARDVDMVFDTQGGAVQEASWSVLRPGGILVSCSTPPDKAKAAALGLRQAFVFIQPNAAILDQLAALVEGGQLRTIIGAEFALADLALAHELSESGHARGKIAIHVGPP